MSEVVQASALLTIHKALCSTRAPGSNQKMEGHTPQSAQYIENEPW